MIIIRSFIFSGLICLIAQVIKDNTKLTSGHICSLFVVVGAFLGFINLYDKIIEEFGAGASVVIISFGNTLYNTAINEGILNMLSGASVALTASIIMGFIITLLFRVKS